ncbi:hypothetical protein KIM372_04240 [Bombiscardovia nodaiensis]|uniref:NADPH-dependent FMN reductase-like domain-containing protein n=1 Tax=Bombiscardovia nodaiensis TaxID=2932181 RepID=A0ABN6SBR0_9BIFI|nr:hypothetical protein KIM372_04240 [Bombiscardovia nodaiensis]
MNTALKKAIVYIVVFLLGLGIGVVAIWDFGGRSSSGASSASQTSSSTASSSPSAAPAQAARAFDKPQHTGNDSKRVFLNASKNKDGNTASLAKQLFDGQSYRQIDLVDYHIPQTGQGEGDFAKVWDQLKGADVIVIGTPVYWSNMSGYLKTFIDNVEINDDLKAADLYLIVQGADADQTNAINSTYGTMNRIAKRFSLNFVGIGQTSDQIKQLHQTMIGK